MDSILVNLGVGGWTTPAGGCVYCPDLNGNFVCAFNWDSGNNTCTWVYISTGVCTAGGTTMDVSITVTFVQTNEIYEWTVHVALYDPIMSITYSSVSYSTGELSDCWDGAVDGVMTLGKVAGEISGICNGTMPAEITLEEVPPI